MSANQGISVNTISQSLRLNLDVRFDKHKADIQSNSYVQEFGLRLLPELYDLYNPLTYDEANCLEVELGIDLRAGGFGVWQARKCHHHRSTFTRTSTPD